MRTREEIEKEVEEIVYHKEGLEIVGQLILEVVLDIREQNEKDRVLSPYEHQKAMMQ